MADVKIDEGIPVPLGRFSWPFAKMKVGDSIFVPHKQSANAGQGWRRLKDQGWVFTARTTVENNVGGVRVWRVK